MEPINLNKFGADNGDRIDTQRIQRLKSVLESNALAFLEYFLPGGKVKGKEYIIGSLHGDTGKSTKISLSPGKIGVGADFAEGETTSDLIDVFMQTNGIQSFPDALIKLEEWTGLNNHRPKPITLDIPEHTIAPAPATITDRMKHLYEDYDHNPIVIVERITKSDGTKQFYPSMADGSALQGESRPLFNLPKIYHSPVVVVCEGEKCAERLIDFGYVATTCIGGAQAPIHKTDWTPLANKHVILWADNDASGMKYMDSLYEFLLSMSVPKISFVEIPAKKPTKWDAADASDDECRKLIDNARQVHQDFDLSMAEYSARSYDDNPPKEEYLLENNFGMGSCAMVAAEGGTGKSMLFLDLCLKVSYGMPLYDEAFGSRVMQKGNSVFLTAEDTRRDVHTRIKNLDSSGKRHSQLKYDLKILPMLSLGSTFPLWHVKGGELVEHSSWSKIREQILEVKNLKLIAFDPLSMLVHADINSDPTVASLVCAQFNRLAVETGACVLISHHFSKGSDYDSHIDTADQARKYVRGTTGLVDSVRNVFCLWKATPQKAQEVGNKLGMLDAKGQIYFGATVKANYMVHKGLKAFRRNDMSGLLECVNNDYTPKVGKEKINEVEQALVGWIGKRAREGSPLKDDNSSSSIYKLVTYCGDTTLTEYFGENGTAKVGRSLREHLAVLAQKQRVMKHGEGKYGDIVLKGGEIYLDVSGGHLQQTKEKEK
jgi:RecA-family ATPase